MKRSLLFVCAALAVTTLAACGKQAGAPSPGGTGAAPPATSPAPAPAPTTPPPTMPSEEKKK